MSRLREALARLVSFVRRDARDGDFDQELAVHIDLATEEHVRRGMSALDARRRALIELGGLEPSRQRHRESRGLPSLDAILQDLRHAFRALRRSPGVTVAAIATLALGIGVNGAVFTLTNAILFKGFPLVDHNDRLLYISSRAYGCCASYPDFEDWRAQATSFESMAVVHGTRVSVSDDRGFAESYDATRISADTFRLVGQRPVLGRDFVSADEMPGAAPVAILSHGFWDRRYARDPSIVGRTVRIDGVPATVIGVMADGFAFPQHQDLWVPLVPTAEARKREARNLWFAFGRLADGVTIEGARAEMDAIGSRLAAAYPQTNQGQPPVVQTFDQFFVGPNATTIYAAMWVAVGFVLLIACANLANLMLARAIDRSREMSLRIALGAGRWRIVRQLLIESVMLSAMGGIVGWWIVRWGIRAYELADRSWRVLDYTMDHRVVAYMTTMSIGTGVLFGLVPAVRLSRLDVNTTLKDGGRGAAGAGRGRRLSALLVATEMALAVVLLAGAGVMVRSLLVVSTARLGIETESILTTQMTLPATRYRSPGAQAAFFDRLTARLDAIPGVESSAVATNMTAVRGLTFAYELAGAPPVDAQRRPTVPAVIVGPDYFRTLGTTPISGREFDDRDSASGAAVVVVNERFARQQWPGEDTLGKRLRLFDGPQVETWRTVVGVVSNIGRNAGAAGLQFDAIVYVPYRQRPTASMWTFSRTRVPPATLGSAVRREVQALDADLPIGNLWTLEQWVQWPYRDQSNLTALFLVFAAVALLLASVGLYAVVAHSVSQRTQEIGVRMAIGATTGEVLRLVLRQGLVPAAAGLAIGLAAALAVTPVLKSVLGQVSPADPTAFAVASIVLLCAAVLGCVVPARRAMRVDPLVALRHD